MKHKAARKPVLSGFDYLFSQLLLKAQPVLRTLVKRVASISKCEYNKRRLDSVVINQFKQRKKSGGCIANDYYGTAKPFSQMPHRSIRVIISRSLRSCIRFSRNRLRSRWSISSKQARMSPSMIHLNFILGSLGPRRKALRAWCVDRRGRNPHEIGRKTLS